MDSGGRPWTRCSTLTELRPQLAQAGITATVLVQRITVAEETQEFLSLADRTPEIAGVVGWVDLTAPDVAERLAALQSAPGGRWLVGVRHQVQAEPDLEWLLRPDVLRGLRAVADAGLSYDLLVTPPQLPAAVRVVRQLPELQFVLDHGGKPPIATGEMMPWALHITELALLPNVAVMLCGCSPRPRWIGRSTPSVRTPNTWCRRSVRSARCSDPTGRSARCAPTTPRSYASPKSSSPGAPMPRRRRPSARPRRPGIDSMEGVDMHTRTLGRTGLALTELGFGAAPIGNL
jgi:predicted TIM-barrel fold metal-dependent hydrolase